jgi:hypothetical protein
MENEPMFGSNNKKKSGKESEGLATSSSRGNMDEYEALRTIIAENPGLLLRVFDKIRVARAMSKTSKTDLPPESDNDKKK